MTIANSLLFARRQWSTPPIPGLPAGYWTATGSADGDASGGDITFQHIFSSPANLLGDSNLYSLEQFMAHSTDSGTTSIGLRLNGMDRGAGQVDGPDSPIDVNYSIPMVTADTTAARRSVQPRDMNMHLWIGQYQGIPTDFGDILFSTVNVTGSNRLDVKCAGYWWTPDAMEAPGGIRRPVGGIYES